MKRHDFNKYIIAQFDHYMKLKSNIVAKKRAIKAQKQTGKAKDILFDLLLHPIIAVCTA